MPHSNRESLPDGKKNKPTQHEGKPEEQASGPERKDRSVPIALLVIIGMGLLLINGFLFLQEILSNLLAR